MQRLKIIVVCSMLNLFSVSAFAAPGEITTVAGGNVGDGQLATETMLNNPRGIAMDGSGNVYVAETFNHRIRKLDVATGLISTVVGNGISGFGGDGGPATEAQLDWPESVVLDVSGNIYISDHFNNRIRKVDGATGIITTLAGGGTTSSFAPISSPNDLFVDGVGNLFISSRNNIRKVNTTTGATSTVAGDSLGRAGFDGDGGRAIRAQLNEPEGVAVDEAGNIYIADKRNNRIRKIDGSTDVITTIAGNGEKGFSGDGGPATTAQLNWPQDVFVDTSGNIFIADAFNNRIRKIDATTGIINTVIGKESSGFSRGGRPATESPLQNPQSVWVDELGNVLVSTQDYVRKMDHETGLYSSIVSPDFGGGANFIGDGSFATDARLDDPRHVFVDSSGSLYITDSGNFRVRKVDGTTGIITTLVGDGLWSSSGDEGLATDARVSPTEDVFVDGAGNVLIADRYRIRKIDNTTGIITTVVGTGRPGFAGDGGLATEAQVGFSTNIFIDGAGNLYIADNSNHRIRKVDGSTGIITTIAGNGERGFSGDGGPAADAQLSAPMSLFIDEANSIYFYDRDNYRIRKIDGSTGIITTVVGVGNSGSPRDGEHATETRLSFVYGVFIDAVGDLFLSTSDHHIFKMDGITGILSTVAEASSGSFSGGFSGDGGPALDAKFFQITGLFIDGSGNLYIADSGNHRVRMVEGIATPTSLKVGVFDPQPLPVVGDFDGNGSVGFPDFLAFAGAFGKESAEFDLTGDGKVGFPDFLIFAANFGKSAKVATKVGKLTTHPLLLKLKVQK